MSHSGFSAKADEHHASAHASMKAARQELIARGAEVSEPFHFTSIGSKPEAGPHPDGSSYFTYATFSDPDGNSFLLQEVTTRLPGRGLSNLDVPNLTALLREAEERHGAYEASAPKHHWSDWYAGYIVARERGKTPDEAVKDATSHVEGALGKDARNR